MKRLKVLSACLTALVLLTLTGCEKCADCAVSVTQKAYGQAPINSVSETELCGDDLKEADGNTITSSSTVSGVTVTMTTKTECR